MSRYRLLEHSPTFGAHRVAVDGTDTVLRFTDVEVATRAIALYYRSPGAKYATTRLESAAGFLQMRPEAAKAIFELTDDGYEHVCLMAQAMTEIWP